MDVNQMNHCQNKVEEISDDQLQKLTALENLLASIIDHLPINFFVIDRNANYILQSADLENIIEGAKKADEIDSASWLDCQQVMRQNRKKIIEEQYQDKWFLSVKSPLIIDQNILGVVGFSIDISEQKKVDDLMKQQEIQQSVINKLKTIAGSLAHEIKTPLAGVRTGLSLLKSFFSKAKQNAEEVTRDTLAQQEQWVSRMIERIDSGNALISMQLKNMVTERIDADNFCQGLLVEWVQQAINTFPFENEAFARKVHLNVSNEITVMGDPLLTQHILWNLLNNAFYFVKETDRGEIFIATESTEKHHILRVKDTAKGMAKEEASKVFNQFYTNRRGGSGLGLHFCQLVMEAYQGRIECQAQEGKYTEFLLFFPKEFDLSSGGLLETGALPA